MPKETTWKQKFIWIEYINKWIEKYPFMNSLIERTIGELRYKEFIEGLDEMIGKAVIETLQEEMDKKIKEIKDVVDKEINNPSEHSLGIIRGELRKLQITNKEV